MYKIAKIIVLSALLATSGCLGAYRPSLLPDADGCNVVLEQEIKYMDKDLGEALGKVVDAGSPAEAYYAIVEFLQRARKGGSAPEIFCRLKAAIFESPGLRLDAYETWSYWTTELVIAKDCSDGAYNVAKKHVTDLKLFAEACDDAERARKLDGQRKLLGEIHAHVVRHGLCNRGSRRASR